MNLQLNPWSASPPEEFRCPISLELMEDPVILSTGQTYERCAIQRWLEAGHRSCPKTKQPLEEDARPIPNYALRTLIQSWAAQHSIKLGGSGPAAMEARAAAAAATAMAAPAIDKRRLESLVKKLGGDGDDGGAVRDAVRELRIVAKEGKEARAAVCEAGGVAAIRSLLLWIGAAGERRWAAAVEAEVEENAVVALLNLAAEDEHKVGMVAEGAIDAIESVLSRAGASRDAKAVAALAVTSLAMVDVNKVTLGRRKGLAAALVGVMDCGGARGRKDAAIALYSLCLLPENRPRIVAAGTVPILLDSLLERSGGEEEERAMALLDALAGCEEGKAAIRRRFADRGEAMAALVAALASGRSERCRESGAAVLAAVCDGAAGRWAAAVARAAGAAKAAQQVAAASLEGSRARRKADRLVKRLNNL